MSIFNNVEVQDHLFTFTASHQRSVNPDTIILSEPTDITTFSAAQFSGVQFWAFDTSYAQTFLNGNSVSGYLLNPTGKYGLLNFTLPAGNWAFGQLYSGPLSGLQTITGFDEASVVTMQGGSFVNNIPMAVSGNAGAWESQGFTITGNPATYIETEGTGGSFMIMNDSQFLDFQASNPSGYHGGGYSYTYALGGKNGGASTEIEGEMLLNPGNWNLVWINDTGAWAGGAANISAFSNSGTSGGITSSNSPTPTIGNDLSVTLNDVNTNQGIGNPSTTTVAGGQVTLHVTFHNTFLTSQSIYVQLYVSTDSTITTSDTPNADASVLGTVVLSPLPANGSSEGILLMRLPSTIAAGVYYVGAFVDFGNRVAESDENNNASAGMAITVTGSESATAPITVHSTSANETFRGAAGDDTAVYSGPVNQYTVRNGGSYFSVTDSVLNRDGADNLINFEHALFLDRSINLTMQSQAAKVSLSQLNALVELYVAYFNRVPEAGGLSYWIDQLVGGSSLSSISSQFYTAGIQYSSVSGYSADMTNADFIKIVYSNVLGRTGSNAPNTSEISYWDNAITAGPATRDTLIQAMLTAAHTYANDPTWNWVTHLLDNKVTVGVAHAVTLGVDYNTSADAITQTVAISHAVTATDTTAAINLIGLSNVHLI